MEFEIDKFFLVSVYYVSSLQWKLNHVMYIHDCIKVYYNRKH